MKTETLKKIVFKSISQENNCKPRFYVVGGSDIYGFKSDKSDTDVRGFHTTPPENFLKLGNIKEQITVNQDGLTDGFEVYPNVELVSYELKNFGSLMYKMNFNILEWLYCGKTFINGEPLLIDKLRDKIMEFLPGNVPYHYFGMAKQNYKKFLNEDSGSYRPEPKKFLYVLRGLLGAKYIQEYAEVESNIREMSKPSKLGIGVDVIDRLIEKRDESGKLPSNLKEEANNLIMELMEGVNYQKSGRNKGKLKKFINKWMADVREVIYRGD